jgi:hypothetical protein
MGRRKEDINAGAIMAVLVLSGIVGVVSWNFWYGLITFFVFGGILSFLRVIR